MHAPDHCHIRNFESLKVLGLNFKNIICYNSNNMCIDWQILNFDSWTGINPYLPLLCFHSVLTGSGVQKCWVSMLSAKWHNNNFRNSISRDIIQPYRRNLFSDTTTVHWLLWVTPKSCNLLNECCQIFGLISSWFCFIINLLTEVYVLCQIAFFHVPNLYQAMIILQQTGLAPSATADLAWGLGDSAGGDYKGYGSAGGSYFGETSQARYCNVPLPERQPLAPKDSEIAERLFIVAVPEAFPSTFLEDCFCRFGNLIDAFFMPGKSFGMLFTIFQFS